MLKLTIPKKDFYNEATEQFVTLKSQTLELEHSLLAISKWERKYQIPFLDRGESDRTTEQILDYIMDMSLTPVNDRDLVMMALSQEELNKVNVYIESKESATTFGEMPGNNPSRGERITSELIYYWMVAFNIPFECETWNLNRLFALIKICNIKNSPQKKIPRHSVAERNREINAARRAKYGTTG